MDSLNDVDSGDPYYEIADILRPYGPQLSLPTLVVEMNNIYHRYEARQFDRIHPFDFRQMPGMLAEMFNCVLTQSTENSFKVLNFGCGTGFEAHQLLLNMPAGAIGGLTCYDPCPEMLEKCVSKISLFRNTTFCNRVEDIPLGEGRYNLLLTNQMLHHLIDVSQTIQSLLPLLSEGAFWISGHEGSSRYFKNPECWKVYQDFMKAIVLPFRKLWVGAESAVS
jgi:2-polyprenyl-3-methyl-5-hydroxy-6-metoxy-1,4-benzoquinol methylase